MLAEAVAWRVAPDGVAPAVGGAVGAGAAGCAQASKNRPATPNRADRQLFPLVIVLIEYDLVFSLVRDHDDLRPVMPGYQLHGSCSWSPPANFPFGSCTTRAVKCGSAAPDQAKALRAVPSARSA